MRIRGGSISLTELHETGALMAAATPTAASMAALILLCLATTLRTSNLKPDTRDVRRLAMVALLFGGLLCATQLLRGETAIGALALSACFAVGAALTSMPAQLVGNEPDVLRAGGDAARLRRMALVPSLATTSVLSLALPAMLALLLVQPSAKHTAAQAGLVLGERLGAASRSTKSVTAAWSAIEALACASRKSIRMLAAAGAGASANEILESVQRGMGQGMGEGVGTAKVAWNPGRPSAQQVLPPLVAALALASSPAEMFLPLWMASAGLLVEALEAVCRVHIVLKSLLSGLASLLAVFMMLPHTSVRAWRLCASWCVALIASPLLAFQLEGAASIAFAVLGPAILTLAVAFLGGGYGVALAATALAVHSVSSTEGAQSTRCIAAASPSDARAVDSSPEEGSVDASRAKPLPSAVTRPLAVSQGAATLSALALAASFSRQASARIQGDPLVLSGGAALGAAFSLLITSSAPQRLWTRVLGGVGRTAGWQAAAACVLGALLVLMLLSALVTALPTGAVLGLLIGSMVTEVATPALSAVVRDAPSYALSLRLVLASSAVLPRSSPHPVPLPFGWRPSSVLLSCLSLFHGS